MSYGFRPHAPPLQVTDMSGAPTVSASGTGSSSPMSTVSGKPSARNAAHSALASLTYESIGTQSEDWIRWKSSCAATRRSRTELSSM